MRNGNSYNNSYKNAYGNVFFTLVKGVGLALGCSLLSTLILACLLRIGVLPEKAIYPVNQTLKVAFILLATIAFVRGEKGWLKGVGIALLFTALSYLAFSAIGGDFSLSWLVFAEVAFALLAGVVGGAIGVNLRH